LSFKELLAEYRSFNGKISQDRINCPEDIFGIITTSGSTGEPKGTMIENRNFVNFAYYYNNLMDKFCTVIMWSHSSYHPFRYKTWDK